MDLRQCQQRAELHLCMGLSIVMRSHQTIQQQQNQQQQQSGSNSNSNNKHWLLAQKSLVVSYETIEAPAKAATASRAAESAAAVPKQKQQQQNRRTFFKGIRKVSEMKLS